MNNLRNVTPRQEEVKLALKYVVSVLQSKVHLYDKKKKKSAENNACIRIGNMVLINVHRHVLLSSADRFWQEKRSCSRDYTGL